MSSLVSDVRFALRSLKNSPAFTIVAVATLALGIGASTAGFSLANWLLLRPVPGIRDGGRIAVIWFGERKPNGFLSQYQVTQSQLPALTNSVTAFRGFAGHQRDAASVTTAERSRHVDFEFVMPSYFAVLGTQPELGRLLVEDDDAPPSGVPVALISHDLWFQLFDGDPGVIGKTVRVNTQLFTVVGVAPSGFHGAVRHQPADMWLPGRTHIAFAAARGGEPSALEPTYSEFFARLADGATFDQAEQQLRAVSQRVTGQQPVVFRGIGVWPAIRASVQDTAALLIAVTAVVLLIACANTANLLLFRGMARRSQTAMRKVLGAGVADLVRERLAESVVLGLLAAGLGVLLGHWLVYAFQGLSPWRSFAGLEHVSLDWRVGRSRRPPASRRVSWPVLPRPCLRRASIRRMPCGTAPLR